MFRDRGVKLVLESGVFVGDVNRCFFFCRFLEFRGLCGFGFWVLGGFRFGFSFCSEVGC